MARTLARSGGNPLGMFGNRPAAYREPVPLETLKPLPPRNWQTGGTVRDWQWQRRTSRRRGRS